MSKNAKLKIDGSSEKDWDPGIGSVARGMACYFDRIIMNKKFSEDYDLYGLDISEHIL
jgi:hypothetical protein